MPTQTHQLPVQLANVNKADLEKYQGAVQWPRYDRSASVPGIVHFGVGGFNRSHLAVYLDDLLSKQAASAATRWAEFGIGLLPADKALHASLAQQDCLYGVLQRDTDRQSYRVIGSLTGHAYAPEDRPRLFDKLKAPECRIISLTVTEGGYFTDDATGAFLADDPAILHDLHNPDSPNTWLGYVAEAANRRMQTRGNPFTLLSCDNLQSNGDTSRKALLAFAGLRSDSLQNWIAANVTFPNSMVDRITPRTTDEDRAAILRDYSIDDLCPVVTEPFRQWVLEDNFAAGRPALEKADVQFSSEVDLYEKTKMRLLNGGHICIAYCSALLGLRFVSNALADPLLHQLLTSFLAEVRVTLHDLPGISLDDYTASVLHRFSNVTIRDQIPRICSDGTAKMSKYIVPALTDLLAAGAPSQLPQLVIATWLFYLKGHAEDGTPITISDPLVDALSPFVASGGTDASLALSVRRVFGDLSVRHPQFAMNVQHYLNQLQAFGVRATIADALAKF